jgi:hypothetical protein
VQPHQAQVHSSVECKERARLVRRHRALLQWRAPRNPVAPLATRGLPRTRSTAPARWRGRAPEEDATSGERSRTRERATRRAAEKKGPMPRRVAEQPRAVFGDVRPE